MNLLIGADPELFVMRNGKFQPAAGLIPGTKASPHPLTNGGAVQVDGMALEFNIAPSSNEDEFVENISNTLAGLRSLVNPDYHFVFSSIAEFTDDVWREAPEEAKVLGCDPDYNAYTLSINEIPESAEREHWRAAAGHIHIGLEDADPSEPDYLEFCAQAARQLDCVAGIISVLETVPDKRRLMYGRAGSFRPKPYGLEYRVLSNYWLSSEEQMRRIYRAVVFSMETLNDGFYWPNYRDIKRVDVEKIINNHDNVMAELIFSTLPRLPV